MQSSIIIFQGNVNIIFQISFHIEVEWGKVSEIGNGNGKSFYARLEIIS